MIHAGEVSESFHLPIRWDQFLPGTWHYVHMNLFLFFFPLALSMNIGLSGRGDDLANLFGKKQLVFGENSSPNEHSKTEDSFVMSSPLEILSTRCSALLQCALLGSRLSQLSLFGLWRMVLSMRFLEPLLQVGRMPYVALLASKFIHELRSTVFTPRDSLAFTVVVLVTLHVQFILTCLDLYFAW